MKLLPFSKIFNFVSKSKNFARTEFARSSCKELLALRTAKQEFADCYLVSAGHALTRSNNGKRILQENIQTATEAVPRFHYTELSNSIKRQYENVLDNWENFKITFKNVYNKEETYVIDAKTFNKNFKIYHKQKQQKTPVLAAIEIAMNKLVNKHFFKKPLISRLHEPFLNASFEYNLPSNFFRMFTGKEPIVLGEKNLNWSLNAYKDEAMELFKRMGQEKNHNYSFVAGTGFQKIGGAKGWHCFVIKKVDWKNKTIHLVNKRTNRVNKLTFDEALSKLKYIVGYFDENLK